MGKNKSRGGAAAPTADDSADQPAHDVVNATPDAVGSGAGVINTTETLHEGATEQPSRANKPELSDSDRKNIVKEAGAAGASVQKIADKYDIEPAEVFAIVDESNL